MAQNTLRQKLLLFTLVPAVVLAVLVLGGIALRTTLQIEKARQQTVFDATLTLADERVDRLDKLVIAQDNVVAANADLTDLPGIARRWLPTAARETPTVRAILVLDVEHQDHDVLAFVSRRPGVEDDAFRRLLISRLFPWMSFSDPTEELPPPASRRGRTKPSHQLLATWRGRAAPSDRCMARRTALGTRRDAATISRYRSRQ